MLDSTDTIFLPDIIRTINNNNVVTGLVECYKLSESGIPVLPNYLDIIRPTFGCLNWLTLALYSWHGITWHYLYFCVFIRAGCDDNNI